MENRIGQKKPRTVTIGVYLDDSLADVVEEATYAASAARDGGASDGVLAEAVAAIGEAQQRLDDATQWFTFTSMGRVAFNALSAEHPATDADTARDPDAQWDAETFPPALIAASLTDPVMTVDEVTALFADPAWNDAELAALVAAALAVNTQARQVTVRGVQP